MSDKEPDRCGICPFTFGGWAVAACIWHDQAYTEGSWHQANMTRKEVDDYFLVLLLYEANQGSYRPLKKSQAYIMYGFVRAFGSYWWEGKE
jgi:hypothetical protein